MKLWGEYGEKTELYRMNIRDRQIEQNTAARGNRSGLHGE